MQVFHIKGFSGILLFIGALLAALVVFLLLPATFMMVLWNAVAFEGLKRGPEVNLYQGFLLWGMAIVAIKLIFKPEIKIQFQRQAPKKTPKSIPMEPMNHEAASTEEPAVTASVVIEEPAPVDSHLP
jgi:hypothetical protein